MVHLSSSTWLGSVHSQHGNMPSHPPSAQTQENPICRPPPQAVNQCQTLAPGPCVAPVHIDLPPRFQMYVQPHAGVTDPCEWQKVYADVRGACLPVRFLVAGRVPGKPFNSSLRVSAPPPNHGWLPWQICHYLLGGPTPWPHLYA